VPSVGHLLRRALHRAGAQLVEGTGRARTDELVDRATLAGWAAAYGHDLLVFHRLDLSIACSLVATAQAHEVERTMTIEHDELATATADAVRTLQRWADDGTDGRAALAAVRAVVDDLVVHDAHERAALEPVATVLDRRPDPRWDHLRDALVAAALAEPPFLGPLALADASPTEHAALLAALPATLADRWLAEQAAHAARTRRALGA
jgi:hypothetical protein